MGLKMGWILGGILIVMTQPVMALEGKATWYSTEACQWNPDPKCPTASGRSLYQLEQDEVSFAAAWDYPFGTKLKVTNLANQKSTIVEIWDRGPHKRLHRIIDLGKLPFSKIADPQEGIIQVRIEKIT